MQKLREYFIIWEGRMHRRRVSGAWGAKPPAQIFDCLLCFDSHNAVSPELKIRLFMYYSWP